MTLLLSQPSLPRTPAPTYPPVLSLDFNPFWKPSHTQLLFQMWAWSLSDVLKLSLSRQVFTKPKTSCSDSVSKQNVWPVVCLRSRYYMYLSGLHCSWHLIQFLNTCRHLNPEFISCCVSETMCSQWPGYKVIRRFSRYRCIHREWCSQEGQLYADVSDPATLWVPCSTLICFLLLLGHWHVAFQQMPNQQVCPGLYLTSLKL